MLKPLRMALIAFFAPVIALQLAAAEKTLDGTLVCAKGYLNKPDAEECQDVLLVAGPDGKPTEFYVTKNKVTEAAGEACTLEVKAAVTGEVTEKDGRLWITPAQIEKK